MVYSQTDHRNRVLCISIWLDGVHSYNICSPLSSSIRLTSCFPGYQGFKNKMSILLEFMDTSTTLGIIAFGLQFSIVLSLYWILSNRVQRIEKAKCKCCSVQHPLLDPTNP